MLHEPGTTKFQIDLRRHLREQNICDNLVHLICEIAEAGKYVINAVRTGDLGVFDKDGFLFIKGRKKNVIVMPNGKNIYPEEIESVINNFHFVVESLVVEKKGKLVALVHFNQEELEKSYQNLKEEVKNYVEKRKEELRKELHDYVNARVNKFSRLQSVITQPDPFQKTATQKIKRFLYS